MIDLRPNVDNPIAPGYNAANPNSLIDLLPNSDVGVRNTIVQSLLSQLYGPSPMNAYASTLLDPLADRYSGRQQDVLSAIAGRGMLESGASRAGLRDLQDAYMGNVVKGRQQANVWDANRKTSLLNSLLGIASRDVGYVGNVQNAAQQLQNVQDAQSLFNLQQLINLGSSAFGLLGTLGGAYTGMQRAPSQQYNLFTSGGTYSPFTNTYSYY